MSSPVSRFGLLVSLIALATGCGSSPIAADAGESGFTLTVTKVGDGTGTVTSSPAGIDCGGGCSANMADGTIVTLSATADAGARFVGWTGGGCTGTGVCTITVSSDVAVSAAFALERSLVVTLTGPGSGVVTSSPAGIDCGADCSEAFAGGTVVTLAATPDTGSTFTGWSGGCTGNGSCSVTLEAAMMVTATFALEQLPLTVVSAGTGQGAVVSDPVGIDCGADCTEDYPFGASVVLTATPTTGSEFTGWSGGGCTGTGTCTTTITAATTVTATFTLTTHGLTVARAGTGTGTVSSTPAGINCGTDCTEDYPFGTSVVLTATPSTGSTFTGWSGGGCSGTGTCATTVT
ncbi:MAG: InlB B-repeat-containing protein, partial [Myxococcaceae bacterium]